MTHSRQGRVPVVRIIVAWVFVLCAIAIAAYPSVSMYRNDVADRQGNDSFRHQVESLWQENPSRIQRDISNTEKYNEKILDDADNKSTWTLPDPWGGVTNDQASLQGTGAIQSPPGRNSTQNRSGEDSGRDEAGLRRYRNTMNAMDSMGRVIVPGVGINIPFYHAGTPGALATGAEHVYGTSLPSGADGVHTGIAAHSGVKDRTLFDRLDDVSKGDVFYIDTPAETLAYTVTDIDVVRPYETESLKPREGVNEVTLITCTPYGVNSHRLLVTGRLTPLGSVSPAHSSMVSSGGSASPAPDVSNRVSQWDNVPDDQSPWNAQRYGVATLLFSAAVILTMVVVTIIVVVRSR